MTAKQHEMAEALIEKYDYISKMDALRELTKLYPNSLNDAVVAYDSVEAYK